ncbi:BON domain-containing protein [Stenotrophomonas sp. MMGLT7]|uniref:BON domain-containing protein n=1 Tax=Stenotrophomonas sp. MMGLT7 TaxID=2901227 RepID=UPI001E34D869|nr:BON domain-containing protein [Stenotrophomonas sp. MMGLT7]MCD7098752.1 BON domain-containing protein [Stenotrophomonas sp. MMGLT7]
MPTARTDGLIADEVIRTLADADGIDAGEILVGLDQGVVTLSGDVPSRQTKLDAGRLVEAVEGVREVRNLLNIDDGSRSFGKPGQAVRGADHQGGPDSTAELDLDENG